MKKTIILILLSMVCLQGYSQQIDSVIFYPNKDLVLDSPFPNTPPPTNRSKWYVVDKNTYSTKIGAMNIGSAISTNDSLILYDTVKNNSVINNIKCQILYISYTNIVFNPYFSIYINGINVFNFNTYAVNSLKNMWGLEVPLMLGCDTTFLSLDTIVNIKCSKGDVVKIIYACDKGHGGVYYNSRFRNLSLYYQYTATGLSEIKNAYSYIKYVNGSFISDKNISNIKIYDVVGTLITEGDLNTEYNLESNKIYFVLFDNKQFIKYCLTE